MVKKKKTFNIPTEIDEEEKNYCIASMQHKRKEQQDSALVQSKHNITIYGVFDGHGKDGRRYSQSIIGKDLENRNLSNKTNFRTNLYDKLFDTLKECSKTYCDDNKITKKIQEAFIELDNDYLKTEMKENDIKYLKEQFGGSTAIMGIQINDKLYIASLGDSSAITFNEQGEWIGNNPLHNGYNDEERKRFEKIGLKIEKGDGITRSFGDWSGKIEKDMNNRKYNTPLITIPDVFTFNIQKELEKNKQQIFLMLGTDGVLGNRENDEDVIKKAKKMKYRLNSTIKNKKHLEDACNFIVDNGESDNSTILIAKLIEPEKLPKNRPPIIIEKTDKEIFKELEEIGEKEKQKQEKLRKIQLKKQTQKKKEENKKKKILEEENWNKRFDKDGNLIRN